MVMLEVKLDNMDSRAFNYTKNRHMFAAVEAISGLCRGSCTGPNGNGRLQCF